MSLFLDILIIITAIAAIYAGIMRGFVKSVMGFVTLLLAMIAAAVLTPTVADFYNEKFVSAQVNEIVETSLTELVTAGGQQIGLSKLFDDRPDALTSVAERFGVDIDDLEKVYLSLKPESDSEAISSLADHIASPTAEAISRILAAISVFLTAMLILKLLTLILDLICRLPVLSTLNTLLGFLFGAASAALGAWVIANLSVGLINALGAIKPEVFNSSVIDSSIIVRFFVENSLVLFN